ncbi:hypothetical protein SLEP1_g12822 [Rubroshorea leprosula]|uniref:Uncharacterized protein n=1 Tax=Rubroshorea leprosula TaxID=152421 RepID=A0AAV5IPD2_9ROSI|nr:hypothetical protein SLEP1_g12822 [Rubroshorea leprosula]
MEDDNSGGEMNFRVRVSKNSFHTWQINSKALWSKVVFC